MVFILSLEIVTLFKDISEIHVKGGFPIRCRSTCDRTIHIMAPKLGEEEGFTSPTLYFI